MANKKNALTKKNENIECDSTIVSGVFVSFAHIWKNSKWYKGVCTIYTICICVPDPHVYTVRTHRHHMYTNLYQYVPL
jgi:hypothetical protein